MTLHQTDVAYNLNQGQREAADKFFDFLMRPEKEFIITGPAGVGKTYLMNFIIDATMPRYHELCKILGEKPKFTEVAMTATTNKAAEVLGQSVKRPTSTTHSFFNLIVRDDYSSGKSVLKRTNKWVPHSNTIIFIDESSMIDSPLWNEIHSGTLDCKIVYVGDRHQLAPVTESLSPIYRHDTEMVELLEPVRNSGQPALMAICQQLRETVNTGVFHPIVTEPGVIDLLDPGQMQAMIDHVFLQPSFSSRILAYTNSKVVAYNDYIRGIRHLPNSFQPGEKLVNAAIYHHTKGQISVEAEVHVLTNHGPSKIMIDEAHDAELDVDVLTIADAYGVTYTKVNCPTNKDHYADLVKYYSRMKKWDLYFFLKNNFIDLRPTDASTVHKAQGSTYDSVFIDLANISTCNNPDQVARILYVAFSRAKSRIFLYGNLAEKYGGVIQK